MAEFFLAQVAEQLFVAVVGFSLLLLALFLSLIALPHIAVLSLSL